MFTSQRKTYYYLCPSQEHWEFAASGKTHCSKCNEKLILKCPTERCGKPIEHYKDRYCGSCGNNYYETT